MDETARFYEVRAWMTSVGACGLCSLGMAIAVVERESGRQAPTLYPCPRRHIDTVSCEQRVRRDWSQRPARDVARAA